MSEIVIEDNMTKIKSKMTEIKRLGGTILQNYYNNCEDSDCIWTVYGNNTVVFWSDDNGVIRVYFYTSDEDELVDVLKITPKDSCMEYLSKNDNLDAIAYRAGFESEFTMHRYNGRKFTKEELAKYDEYWNTLREAVGIPGYAKTATLDDAKEIFDKLYEVFNSRESHLCSFEELVDYIEKRWVCCTRNSDGKLNGFQMFCMLPGYTPYGYQIWSDDDPVVLANIQIKTEDLIKEYLQEVERETGKHIERKPSFAWVNKDNRRAVKNVKAARKFFDGLADYGYRKIE